MSTTLPVPGSNVGPVSGKSHANSSANGAQVSKFVYDSEYQRSRLAVPGSGGTYTFMYSGIVNAAMADATGLRLTYTYDIGGCVSIVRPVAGGRSTCIFAYGATASAPLNGHAAAHAARLPDPRLLTGTAVEHIEFFAQIFKRHLQAGIKLTFDARTRRLYAVCSLGRILIKRVKRSAHAQIRALRELQKHDFEPVNYPVRWKEGCNTMKKIEQLVNNLNRNHLVRLIRFVPAFEGGTGIAYEFRD